MREHRRERPLGLIEQLAEAALALEGDGRVAFANTRASELFGRSAADLIGRRVDELLPPRIRQQPAAQRAFELDRGRPAVHDIGDVAAERADGDEFPIEVHVSPDGDGRIVTLRDISERVEVQTSLRRGSERLALDGPNARVGSWEWNFVAGTVTWSDQLYRIYGFESHAFEPTYEQYLSLVHADERDGIEARHRQALADHQPFSDIKRMRRADGAEILVRTDGEIILAADGTPLRMIGVSEDVSDYERTRALLLDEPV